jgi:hypothetical protein
VPFVGCQDRAGMLFVVDEDVVGALPAYAAHEPLCVTVGPSRQLHPMPLVEHGLLR